MANNLHQDRYFQNGASKEMILKMERYRSFKFLNVFCSDYLRWT